MFWKNKQDRQLDGQAVQVIEVVLPYVPVGQAETHSVLAPVYVNSRGLHGVQTGSLKVKAKFD